MVNAVFQGNSRCEEGADGPHQTGSERPSEGEEQRAVGSSASGGGTASSAPPPCIQPGILRPLSFLYAPCPHSYPYNASIAPSFMLPFYHQFLSLFIQMIFLTATGCMVCLYIPSFLSPSDSEAQEGTLEGSIQRAH